MRFTYTYAALAVGLFGDSAIGAPQKPTNEQDATVRAIVLKISDALNKATAGRLSIASLDLVPDVKRADVVISLTEKPARGGWAMTSAIEGRPGQIGLYYQTLEAEIKQDVILTAAHEVCHYIFGLTDEYNFPSGCPRDNPGGPGCLMDNYLSQGSRHGWYGRFCSNDHVTDPAQKQSCQDIVDKFFRDRNVTTPGKADDGAPRDLAEAEAKLGTRNSKLENIKNATIGLVREQFQANIKDKKGSTTLNSISSFKSIADKFLTSQLQRENVGISADEKKTVIEGVLKQTASIAKLAIPPRFDPLVNLIGKFAENRAKQLREQSPNESDSSRKQKISKALLAFLSGLSGAANAPVATGNLTPEEKKFLDEVATRAATMTDQKKQYEDLFDAALNHIRLDRESAGTILDIAGEVGVVGIENRLEALGEIDTSLKRFIPGRTASTGFGRRRTIIIDPDPLDPLMDYVITLSGIHRYTEIRDQNVDLFSKLVERAQVELLLTDIQRTRQDERRKLLAKPTEERAREELGRQLAELADRNKIRSQRETELRRTIGDLGMQIRRNRLENIVFLIPPGGLPHDIGALFEGLRRQLIVQGDVRLDLVLVGPEDVPLELRDIAIGSGGSISTLADIDEIGALAQRLKNDQSSGAWVIVPHQDVIRGPRADLEVIKNRKDQKWILNDVRGGGFQGSPIDAPYLDVQSRVDRLYAYFFQPIFFRPEWGIIEKETWAEHDLGLAGILSPDAIKALSRTIHDSMQGSLSSSLKGFSNSGQSPSDSGLREELAILFDTIHTYNSRNSATGLGDTMRSDVIEHVIRARGYYQSIKSALEIALAAHEKFVAPDYDEERLIEGAYKRFDSASKTIEPFLQSPSMIESSLEELLRVPELKYLLDPKTSRTTDSYLMFHQDYSSGMGSEGWHKPIGRSSIKNMTEILTRALGPDVPIGEFLDPKFSEPTTPADKLKFQKLVAAIEADFWSKYPDKIRINLILASLDQDSESRSKIQSNALDAVWNEIKNKYKTTWRKDLQEWEPPNGSQSTRSDAELKILQRKQDTYDAAKRLADHVNNARRHAAPTLAYISLRKQEIRLRAVQQFLDHIERDLVDIDKVPLSRRIDRRALVLAMERLQDAAPSGIDAATGKTRSHPMAPVDTYKIENGIEKRRPNTFRLPRFYAENILYDQKKQLQAEFELIIGFSKPLPGIDITALRENRTDLLPELKLYDDNGQLINTPSLRFDRDLSTPTCLVYHFAPAFKVEGWYTGALILKERTYQLIGSDEINFTFSVASTRPNFRLNTALMQMPNDPELIPPPPNRGLLRAMDQRARIEVQVYGGTSILSASIRGIVYKISEGSEKIDPIGQTFYDDGVTSGDRKGGDGVYTTLIPLDQIETGIEYRLLIQAESTDNSRNIPPEDPNQNDEDRRKEAAKQGVKTVSVDPSDKVVVPAPTKADPFQRATSIQIRVER